MMLRVRLETVLCLPEHACVGIIHLLQLCDGVQKRYHRLKEGKGGGFGKLHVNKLYGILLRYSS